MFGYPTVLYEQNEDFGFMKALTENVSNGNVTQLVRAMKDESKREQEV